MRLSDFQKNVNFKNPHSSEADYYYWDEHGVLRNNDGYPVTVTLEKILNEDYVPYETKDEKIVRLEKELKEANKETNRLAESLKEISKKIGQQAIEWAAYEVYQSYGNAHDRNWLLALAKEWK